MINERQRNRGGVEVPARIDADAGLTGLDLLNMPGRGKAKGSDGITGSYKNIHHKL